MHTPVPKPIHDFAAELQRRRVPRTLLWYVGSAVAVVEAANAFLPTLGAPAGAMRLIVIIAIFGLPIALTLSWMYDVTSESGRGWSRTAAVALVSVLCVLGGFTVWNIKPGSAGTASAASASEDANHLAVLRFETDDRDPELVAFAADLQTRLIDGLSAASAAAAADTKRLRVVSRAGILPFSKSDIPLDSVRRALHVGTVLEGSVDRVPGGLKVSVRLVDAASGDQIAVTEVPASDRLTIVNSVADSVARLIRTSLGKEMRNRVRMLETSSPAAFDRFVLATQLADQFDSLFVSQDLRAAGEALNDADSAFAEAERNDPKWIEPIVQRGHLNERRVRLVKAMHGADLTAPLHDGIAEADRALKLRPDDYRAFELRGQMRELLYAITQPTDSAQARELADAAQADLQNALIGNPTPARALRVLSELAGLRGQIASAVQYGKRAYQADPYLEEVNITVFRMFEYSFRLGNDSDAASWCAEGRSRFLDNTFDDCRLMLGAWSPAYPLTLDSAWLITRHELGLTPPAYRAMLEPRLDALVAAVLARHQLSDSARHVVVRAHARDRTGGVLRASAGVFELLQMRDSADKVLQQLMALPPARRGDLERAPELRAVRARTHDQSQQIH